MNMTEFELAYLECALWSSTDNCRDDGGDPLDKNYGIENIAEEALESLRKDCKDFVEAHAALIEGRHEQAGQDFWLNRNGRGSGFWDGDWPEPAASVLDKASKAFGSVDLYVGDDGKIYVA